MAIIIHNFCTIEDLHQQSTIVRWVDCLRDEVSAIYHQNKVFVFSSICPHFGGPLRRLKTTSIVRCPWHGLEFDLIDGKCVQTCGDKSKNVFKRMFVRNQGNPMGVWDNLNLTRYDFQIIKGEVRIIYNDKIDYYLKNIDDSYIKLINIVNNTLRK